MNASNVLVAFQHTLYRFHINNFANFTPSQGKTAPQREAQVRLGVALLYFDAWVEENA